MLLKYMSIITISIIINYNNNRYYHYDFTVKFHFLTYLMKIIDKKSILHHCNMDFFVA